MSERRAEERHDAVAHHLVDGAFESVDGFHHVLEDGIKKLARFFRVAVGQQLHRPLEIGEQHRHLLALAFERGLGGEDFLDEVLRRVALGRLELLCRLRQWCAALTAKLLRRRV